VVAQGVRLVNQRTRIVVAVLVVVALLVIIGSTGIGSPPIDPFAGKAEGSTTNALGVGGVLNVLLAAGITGVVLNAIITSVRERNARKRELLGLLRMLYVEIEVNRGEATVLLDAPNLQAGWWTDNVYKDDTWKEVRSRLSQLLPDEDNFNLLVAYYANNAPNEKGIFKMIESGRSTSLSAPGDAFARLMAEKTREQRDLAVDILDTIHGYIGDPPIGRESVEDAKRQVERHQRELDAERDPRKE
jgi:hypothetical protein